jgi:WhiB family transcriptional regulator, redox-sensing transcriptional regulator
MTSSGTSSSWWSQAACQSADPELFFPISALDASARDVVRAKAICGLCSVRPQCLAHAMEAGSLQGIWGGTTEAERRRLRGRATRARRRLAAQATAASTAAPRRTAASTRRTHVSGR